MKKIKHFTYVGLLLLAAIQALPTFASEVKNFESSAPTNQAKPDKPASSQVKAEPEIETFPSFSPRIGAFFTTEGAGFDDFGSFEAFIPLFQSPGKNLTFLEGKLLWTTSNGALGGNLLLGHRFLSDSGKYLVGGYVSFDSRNTGDTVFNQLGAGFESLSDSLDFRANVYLPIGNKSVVLAEANPGTFAFRGNALEIDRVQLFQQALTGFDAEVGTKLAPLGSGSLRGYAGLYYYTAEDINGFVGVRGRLVARPNNNLVVGLTLQSDSVFDTRLIFNIGVNLSPGSSTRRSKNSVLARMNESPERQSSIAVDNVLVKDTVAAIDPATGLAYNFQQVNLGLGSSNGTIESPFGTIQAALNVAKPGDIVYVRSGTNPGVPGFTIPDGVEVVSTATPKFIQTQVGNIQLPLSGSGILPTVTGTVTLGNNTTLSGFAIANSAGTGVEGSNISNVSIEDNTITNSRFQGINLNNVTGKVEILNNTIDKTGNSFSGIDTSNNTGAVDLAIAGNQVKNATSSGDQNALSDGDGISIVLEGAAKGNVNILDNTVTNNGRTGILLESLDNAQATATISNNTSSENLDAGILTYFEKNTQGNITISNNNVSGNKNGGIENYFVDDSQGNMTISENNSSENNGGGIFLGLYDNAQVSATISNNQIFGNKNPSINNPTPEGIGVYADGTAKGDVSITNNTLADNYYGIVSSTNESASLKVSITSNNITRSLQDGVVITTSLPLDEPGPGTSQTNVSLQNNTVSGNNTTGEGFGDVSVANFRNGSDICVQAKNNTFGTLTLADKPLSIPLATQQTLFAKQQQGTITPSEFQTLILSQLDGTVRIEGTFPGTNTGTLNPLSQSGTIWSNTTAQAGSCGFGN
ncbi:MAG: right-handed parallel beta-helix repeat-containing protein [Nostoc sp.]|uniref:right-handed parallel beta-helix repeat-containing protein n=1 Tax=Nostoc sp. TaxID=1180 RepID=UPI002FFB7110